MNVNGSLETPIRISTVNELYSFLAFMNSEIRDFVERPCSLGFALATKR